MPSGTPSRGTKSPSWIKLGSVLPRGKGPCQNAPMGNGPVYLDYNATTPVLPEVLREMLPWFTEHPGNPSSPHVEGFLAHRAVEEGRGRVAAMLGARPSEIVFTSGGSEADNTAILGVARARGRGHVITTAIEHPAVLEPCRRLEEEGFRVTRLPVDGKGRIDPDDLRRALAPDTILASVMLANNEVGTLQPVREVAAACREAGVLLHVDACQAVGKVPVDVRELGADLVALAGHKFYAPKGIGVLWVREGLRLPSLVLGAGQGTGRRAGTENVPGIAGIGAAAALVARDLPATAGRLRALRDRLRDRLLAEVPGLVVHGDPDGGLPNTLSVSFPGVTSGEMLSLLVDRVACSAGAACHGGEVRASHVLRAMGVPPGIAAGTLRLTTGRPTTEGEIDRAAAALVDAWRTLRR